MNWITDVLPRRSDRSEAGHAGEPVDQVPGNRADGLPQDLESNLFVIPGSGAHMRMGSTARLKSIFDNGTWFDVQLPEAPIDPLKFRDEKRYVDRLKDAARKTGMNDAIKVGFGKLEGPAGNGCCAGHGLHWPVRLALRLVKPSSRA